MLTHVLTEPERFEELSSLEIKVEQRYYQPHKGRAKVLSAVTWIVYCPGVTKLMTYILCGSDR